MLEFLLNAKRNIEYRRKEKHENKSIKTQFDKGILYEMDSAIRDINHAIINQKDRYCGDGCIIDYPSILYTIRREKKIPDFFGKEWRYIMEDKQKNILDNNLHFCPLCGRDLGYPDEYYTN